MVEVSRSTADWARIGRRAGIEPGFAGPQLRLRGSALRVYRGAVVAGTDADRMAKRHWQFVRDRLGDPTWCGKPECSHAATADTG
ncbi:hypothetical protein [Saccharopolyspora sp. ASAGF58]|uniref:hypothetical protein n=1 Tax=Saccharopolyspora sp. ASAGF58 TaxID=2719023 RepID=UPI00143FE8AF|nr:hypothetical protein [Saccharopolyspora sp. ASAGF58]QIZ36960.1 hypothetical protein FDZ84_22805 [Saccharopolyspora sp. ASAGF58]